MGFILMIFLCVNNAFRARVRGLKPGPWVLFTMLAMFGGIFISMCVIVITWMKQYGYSPKQVEAMQAMIKSGELALNDWNVWFLLVCAFGGYLFVRYLIDKRPKLTSEPEDDQLS